MSQNARRFKIKRDLNDFWTKDLGGTTPFKIKDRNDGVKLTMSTFNSGDIKVHLTYEEVESLHELLSFYCRETGAVTFNVETTQSKGFWPEVEPIPGSNLSYIGAPGEKDEVNTKINYILTTNNK
jgi:hypothetical protein